MQGQISLFFPLRNGHAVCMFVYLRKVNIQNSQIAEMMRMVVICTRSLHEKGECPLNPFMYLLAPRMYTFDSPVL